MKKYIRLYGGNIRGAKREAKGFFMNGDYPIDRYMYGDIHCKLLTVSRVSKHSKYKRGIRFYECCVGITKRKRRIK